MLPAPGSQHRPPISSTPHGSGSSITQLRNRAFSWIQPGPDFPDFSTRPSPRSTPPHTSPKIPTISRSQLRYTIIHETPYRILVIYLLVDSIRYYFFMQFCVSTCLFFPLPDFSLVTEISQFFFLNFLPQISCDFSYNFQL